MSRAWVPRPDERGDNLDRLPRAPRAPAALKKLIREAVALNVAGAKAKKKAK